MRRQFAQLILCVKGSDNKIVTQTRLKEGDTMDQSITNVCFDESKIEERSRYEVGLVKMEAFKNSSNP